MSKFLFIFLMILIGVAIGVVIGMVISIFRSTDGDIYVDDKGINLKLKINMNELVIRKEVKFRVIDNSYGDWKEIRMINKRSNRRLIKEDET